MRRLVLIGIVLATATGCARVSESRLNPFNWFGGSSTSVEQTDTLGEIPARAEDSRPLVAEVTALTIERTRSGAIIRATGLPPTQGWHDAELVPETVPLIPVGGVDTDLFRASPPDTPTRTGTPVSRQITVGAALPQAILDQTTSIQVIGASNARISRR